MASKRALPDYAVVPFERLGFLNKVAARKIAASADKIAALSGSFCGPEATTLVFCAYSKPLAVVSFGPKSVHLLAAKLSRDAVAFRRAYDHSPHEELLRHFLAQLDGSFFNATDLSPDGARFVRRLGERNAGLSVPEDRDESTYWVSDRFKCTHKPVLPVSRSVQAARARRSS